MFWLIKWCCAETIWWNVSCPWLLCQPWNASCTWQLHGSLATSLAPFSTVNGFYLPFLCCVWSLPWVNSQTSCFLSPGVHVDTTIIPLLMMKRWLKLKHGHRKRFLSFYFICFLHPFLFVWESLHHDRWYSFQNSMTIEPLVSKSYRVNYKALSSLSIFTMAVIL